MYESSLAAIGVTIDGTVSYSGTATGLLFVATVTNAVDLNLDKGWEWEVEASGAFTNDYQLTDLPAVPSLNVYTVETVVGVGPYYYRIQLE